MKFVDDRQDSVNVRKSYVYTYDGSGIRVKRSYGGVATTYIFSGTKPIAEYVGGAVTKEYIYSGGTQLAEIAYSGLNYSMTYKYPDHLSTRDETDASGNLTRIFGHLPFGETWYETGTSSKWKFTTYERDSESNNDYATFRYYENRLGRFMTADPYSGSTDPLVPQTWNKFAYVMNDPLNLYDPTGLCGERIPFAWWDEYVSNRTYRVIWVPVGPPCSRSGVGGGGAGNTPLQATPDESSSGTGSAANNCTPGTAGCFNVPTRQQGFNRCVDQAAQVRNPQLRAARVGQLVGGLAIVGTVALTWEVWAAGEGELHALDATLRTAAGGTPVLLLYIKSTQDVVSAHNEYDLASAKCQEDFGYPNVP